MQQVVSGRLQRRPELSLRWPRGLLILLAMETTAAAPDNSPSSLPTGPARGLTRDEVMTACEVAELLQLPVSTVYYLARRGEIPACRLGRAWRFLRPRIEEKLAA
jgi:excisionase family DNA binding protein